VAYRAQGARSARGHRALGAWGGPATDGGSAALAVRAEQLENRGKPGTTLRRLWKFGRRRGPPVDLRHGEAKGKVWWGSKGETMVSWAELIGTTSRRQHSSVLPACFGHRCRTRGKGGAIGCLRRVLMGGKRGTKRSGSDRVALPFYTDTTEVGDGRRGVATRWHEVGEVSAGRQGGGAQPALPHERWGGAGVKNRRTPNPSQGRIGSLTGGPCSYGAGRRSQTRFNLMQTVSNFDQHKKYLAVLQKFKINDDCEGFKERNKFLRRNFSIFEMYFI
jgi:hypothetical protein